MRVVCPSCDAQYEVPDQLIGAGRRLRCTRCRHDWLVQPPPASASPAEAPPVRPPVATSPPATSPPATSPPVAASPPVGPGLRRPPQVPHPPLPQAGSSRAGLGLWLAWLGSLLAVALLLAGLWLFRAELTAVWPPLARLYGWLGT